PYPHRKLNVSHAEPFPAGPGAGNNARHHLTVTRPQRAPAALRAPPARVFFWFDAQIPAQKVEKREKTKKKTGKVAREFSLFQPRIGITDLSLDRKRVG